MNEEQITQENQSVPEETGNQIGEVEVCKAILEKHGVTINMNEVQSSSRNAETVFVRALMCTILKKRGLSLARIGKCVGGKNHATVIHLLKWDTKKQCRDEMYGTTGKTYLQIFNEVKNTAVG